MNVNDITNSKRTKKIPQRWMEGLQDIEFSIDEEFSGFAAGLRQSLLGFL